MYDLGPAADRIAQLLPRMTEQALTRSTPCVGLSVGDLLDHVVGLSVAFRYAAEKAGEEVAGAPPPTPSAHNLEPGWREALPEHLRELAAAWRRPEAWTGMTRAGGLQLPGEVAGLVALDELVMHGWDLARGLGVPYQPDDGSVRAIFGFLQESAAEGADREGLFGPVIEVPADAPLFDRALGLAGRDPEWSPSS